MHGVHIPWGFNQVRVYRHYLYALPKSSTLLHLTWYEYGKVSMRTAALLDPARHRNSIPSLECLIFQICFLCQLAKNGIWGNLDGYAEHACINVLARMVKSALEASYIMQPSEHLKPRRIISASRDGTPDQSHFDPAQKQIRERRRPSADVIFSILATHSTQNPRSTMTLPIPHRHTNLNAKQYPSHVESRTETSQLKCLQNRDCDPSVGRGV
jgi:hypothetical protein